MVAAASLPGLRRVGHAMGIPIVVDVRDDGVQDAVIDALYDWLRWVDATFSTYKPDSEVMRLNRGELTIEEAHPDVQWVLRRCEELREGSNGYFDARRAGIDGVDPSGFVKGWSIDRAAAFLRDSGLRNFAINAGGDVYASGRAVPSLAWRIGIQHPLEREWLAAVVDVADAAVATSGAYERGDHVVDPHTGAAPPGVLSVTVVGPELGTADAYATAAFAMGGIRGPVWTARHRRYEAMTILADGTVLTTSGFPTARESDR